MRFLLPWRRLAIPSQTVLVPLARSPRKAWQVSTAHSAPFDLWHPAHFHSQMEVWRWSGKCRWISPNQPSPYRLFHTYIYMRRSRWATIGGCSRELSFCSRSAGDTQDTVCHIRGKWVTKISMMRSAQATTCIAPCERLNCCIWIRSGSRSTISQTHPSLLFRTEVHWLLLCTNDLLHCEQLQYWQVLLRALLYMTCGLYMHQSILFISTLATYTEQLLVHTFIL